MQNVLNIFTNLSLKVTAPLSWLRSPNIKIIKAPLLSDKEILALLNNSQQKKINKHLPDVAYRQAGDRRSIHRGYGIDYEESRRYQTGDDPRYMNWQLSARTGHHFMKVFREEKQAGVFIVIDKSLTMRFGTKKRLKVTQAVRAAAIAAFSALHNNLSVSGLIIEQQLKWFTETQNKQRIFNFIQQAAKAPSPVYEAHIKQEHSLHQVLKLLNEVLCNKSGSIIYLISDFHSLDDKCQPVLLQMAGKHHLNAIKVTDIAEIKMPNVGQIKLKNIRQQDEVIFDSHSKNENDHFESMAAEHSNTIKNIFDSLAISYQEILASSDNIFQDIKT